MDIVTDTGRMLNAKTSRTSRQWDYYKGDENWLMAAASTTAGASVEPTRAHWEKVKFLLPPEGRENVPRGHRAKLNKLIKTRLGHLNLFPEHDDEDKWKGFFAVGVKIFERP